MDVLLFLLVGLLIVAVVYILTKSRSIENPNNVEWENIENRIVDKVSLTIKAEVPQATGDVINNLNKQGAALYDQQSKTLDGQIKNLLTPAQQDLKNLKDQIGELGKSYQSHVGNTESLQAEIERMRQSTNKFNELMSDNKARGDWGEFQLENLVKSAGMIKYVDYVTQETLDSGLRPDMKITLPNDGCIIIDSKFPADSYFRFLNANEDHLKRQFLDEHVKAIESHVKVLHGKNYGGEVNRSSDESISPEFVVMFMPVESMFLDAVTHTHNLYTNAVEKRVILASPLNLLGFLLAVAKGWESFELEKNMKEIVRTADEIYSRIAPLAGHIDTLGNRISQATDAYNSLTGSFEKRVLPSLKRFETLGLKSDDRVNGFKGHEIDEIKLLKQETLELSEDSSDN
tara:strand:+ start:121 stop:1326 length:1206 start_codon:yes stop_codon:yes gene_type:complete